ncbi:MAG TPA: hypothetical protein VGM90_03270 [Kofleriaceae bacterium]|jgi:tetratricopeptide (TPR) repeat protein
MRIAIVVAVLAAFCGKSWAAPTAETLYSEGQAAYERTDYAIAIERWQESYRLSKQPALLYNVAQAYRMAGDCVHALSSYRQFTAADPRSERRPLADEFARELEAQCGQSSLEVAEPRGLGNDSHSASRLKVAGFATAGAGAAFVITGLLIGRHASTLGDEVTRACAQSCDWAEQGSKDSTGRHYATVGYTLDALGVTAIAAGAVMYYVGDRRTALSILPRSNEAGASVTWSGSW